MSTETHRWLRSDLPAVLRCLGVLLLLGVVAMHELAGGDHMATMASAPAAMRTALPPGAAHVPSVGMPSVRGTDMPTLDADGSGRHAGACLAGETTTTATRSATRQDSMPICLAVLPGFLLLAPPSAAGTAGATPVDAARPTRCRTSLPGRGPPRDALTQLCVLRT